MIDIIEKLSSFDENIRKESLYEIKNLIKKGIIKKDSSIGWLNLHLHTFHSFNYKNWSPGRIVFEGWKIGLKYIGTVDFDTLTGLEETILAGEILGIDVIGGFESRVFIPECKNIIINSPKEPGIYYLCGKGFKRHPGKNSETGKFFHKMKEIAQERNKKVIEKLNNYLKEIKIDYKKDVLPLTPSENPTERHIILAYQRKSEEILQESVDKFWSEILEIPENIVKKLRKEKQGDFQEKIRVKLVKYGGPGYIFPEKESFPKFDEVVAMTEKAGGIPIGTWLDGTNEGEKEPTKLLEFLKSKKIKGITIIPERNWNIKDIEEKKEKVKNLEKFMSVCEKIEMPVICGTEMNKFGQPFVDDFTQPELSKYLPYFLKSAEKLSYLTF